MREPQAQASQGRKALLRMCVPTAVATLLCTYPDGMQTEATCAVF